jgi:hypothetical protein
VVILDCSIQHNDKEREMELWVLLLFLLYSVNALLCSVASGEYSDMTLRWHQHLGRF